MNILEFLYLTISISSATANTNSIILSILIKMNQRNMIKGKPLNFNVGLPKWYVKELLKLVDDLTSEVYEVIKPLYKDLKILTWVEKTDYFL